MTNAYEKITVDILSSSSASVELTKEILMAPNVVAQEGYAVVVKLLDDKDTYNKVETSDGEFVTYKKGDVIVGALGERQALRGYSGIIPRLIRQGDTLNILNMGGIIGHCQSPHPDFGPAMRVEVLGAVMIPDGKIFKHACIQDFAIDWEYSLEKSVPLIAVTGTCMNVGKTLAATRIVEYLAKQGYRIGAAKLTGASLKRDVRSMLNAGAAACIDFSSAGLVSTTGKNILPMAKGLLTHLNKEEKLDAIILEFGDGIIGAYGVDSLLMDKEIQQHIASHVVAAQDFMGCWAADNFFRKRYSREIDVITGPVTDNLVGIQFLQNTMGIKAINGMADPEQLGAYVEQNVFHRKPKTEDFF